MNTEALLEEELPIYQVILETKQSFTKHCDKVT